MGGSCRGCDRRVHVCVGHCRAQVLRGEDCGKVHFLTHLLCDFQCWLAQKGTDELQGLHSFSKVLNPSTHQFLSLSFTHTNRHTHTQRHTHSHARAHTVTSGELILSITSGLHWSAKGKTKDETEVEAKPAWLQTLSGTAVL